MYITFIFKLPNGPKAYNTYYGKYHTDHILPEHEGLDEVIKPYLLKITMIVNWIKIIIFRIICFL